jgi:simple sugar transport system permease protein
MISGFFVAMVIAATPLLLATLGELMTEKAGHLNLGVEGMMLLGAVAGFGAGYSTDSPILAVIAAAMAGGFGGLIYGFLTITLRANQVVSGLTLTIFGTGLSSFIGTRFVGKKMSDSFITFFEPKKIPILGDIPFIGPIMFEHDYFIYGSYTIAILLGVYLYKTRIGLHLTAVGENPSAADASGINVALYKYVHVVMGGALCGLGGAYLATVDVPQWQDGITAGRGWIAIALVIFVSWNPIKAIFGSLLFGGLSIIGFRLQQFNISQNLLDALPYIVTIVVLIISSMRKSKENGPPKGLSVPYFREER